MLLNLIARLWKAIAKLLAEDGPPWPFASWSELPEEYWPEWYRAKVRERKKNK